MPKRPPRLAVVVADRLAADTRAEKVALAAARDGWDVCVFGRSTGPKLQRSQIGAVQLVAVPVGNALTRGEKQQRTSGSALLQPGATGPRGLEAWQAAYDARTRLRSERVSLLGDRRSPGVAAVRLGLRGASVLDRWSHRARTRLSEWDLARLPDPDQPVGDWRHDQPALLDLDLALGPQIERFRPDVIHAVDVTTLNTASVTAARLRRRGDRVTVVYDAVRYVDGVDWPSARSASAHRQLEAEYVNRVGGVVTTSPEIAAALRRDHGLSPEPVVVRETPIRALVGSHRSPRPVRVAARVPEDVTLLLHTGPLQPAGALDTAIDALHLLPGVHLAIVSELGNRQQARLQRRADRLGVGERVHLLAAVEDLDIADHRSADIGVVCPAPTTEAQLSVPLELAEHVQAGLPVVVTDLPALSAYVTTHGIGRVFAAGAADSFADAVRTVLTERPASSPTDAEQVQDELSWEHQSLGLLQLYRDASGLAPKPRPALGWGADDADDRGAETAPVPRRKPKNDEVPWRQLSDTRVKLGLGSANYAGQLAALAQAVTAADADVSAEVITRNMSWSLGYPSDVYVDGNQLGNLTVQLELVRRVLPRYTHLIADAFLPVFGYLNGFDIAGDLPALTRAGVKTALLCHGTEIRNPQRHLERLPYSHFRFAPEGKVEELTEKARHNAEILARFDLPVYVTTPDLLADVPQATWIPLVVDVDAWSCDDPVLVRPRPVVFHAPSARWSKGTDLFLPDLEQLDARGVIELRVAEGVPWAEMRELVRSSDIVVDQVAVGSYGTLACEAMAAGKPVIAHLTDTVIGAFDGPPPLVNTEPTGVGATVERLLDDRAGAAAIGRRAHDFARRVHDGRRSAELLRPFLNS